MKKKKRVYSKGSYRAVFPSRNKCIFCNKQTTRQTGLVGHYICSKCDIENSITMSKFKKM